MQHRPTALDNTIPGLKKPSADFRRLVARIQQKIITYGVCSESEQRLLERFTDYGHTTRKTAK